MIQEDIDSAFYENVAIATSTQTQEIADTVVTALPFMPELSIDKTASEPSINLGDSHTYTDAGDTILYTYEITNTGTVTMYDVAVSDGGPIFNGNNGTGSLSAIICEKTTLLPNEVTICRAVYSLSILDVINAAGVTDGVKNIATTTATDPKGDEYESDMDMALTTIIESPTIELQKKAITPLTDTNGDGIIWIGDEIQYVFTVINTGNTVLNNIEIADSKLTEPITCVLTTLFPGERTICTGSYIISENDASNGEIINTATVLAESPIGTLASDISDDPNDPTTATSDPTVVELPCPSLACIAFVNMTLPSTGLATITSESLGYAPGLILELSDADGNIIANNELTCEHAGKKLTYRIIHPCSPSGCWGEINLETKSTPTSIETITEVMCGVDAPVLMSLNEVLDSIQNQGCFVEFNDLYENTVTTGDQCTGYTTIRKVYGKYQIHEVPNQVLLQVDTVRTMPLDTAMVLCPVTEVLLSCNLVDQYPSAAYIDSILGVEFAYPYLDKGQVIDSVRRVDTLQKDSVYTEMVEISPGIWTLLEVIGHHMIDSAYYVYDTTDVHIAIVIPVSAMCL